VDETNAALLSGGNNDGDMMVVMVRALGRL